MDLNCKNQLYSPTEKKVTILDDPTSRDSLSLLSLSLTWCKIMGLLAKSTRGLGTLSVSGLSRVPNPPTKIKAFMAGDEALKNPQPKKITKIKGKPSPPKFLQNLHHANPNINI
jgi:hypothetical protein